MKKLQQGILLLALASTFGLSSCSDESPWGGSESEGSIALSLQTDGRVMRHGTRADDTLSPVVPDGGAFGVKLTNADESYSKSWTTVDAFNKEKSFPIGDYKLEAFYGDSEREGFELPCFKGSADVHVSPGATTEANITATLANAMVSVRYSDTFTANFGSYSAAVQTPGHDWVVFAQNETRPAYISAGAEEKTKLSITMTNAEGKTVTVEPASFETKPRRHYVITINATGNISSGDLALDVEFDEEVVQETVNISLGDDLFNSPAPSVKPKDFQNQEELAMLEYEGSDRNPQFDIFAFGGFNEVTLNVIGGDYTPTFGRSVQLRGADALTQSQLAQEGVKVSGLFKNPDKMAVVNVKDFVENLPAGSYTIQLQAKDAMTRLSEPVDLKVKIDKVAYTVTSAGSVNYRADEVTVDVTTNSARLKDKITFQAPDANNRMVEAPVKRVTPITASDGQPYAYRFVLDVAPVSTKEIDVKSVFGRLSRNCKVAVNAPAYNVTVDPFARMAVLRIDTDNAALKKELVESLKVYNGNNQITASNIRRDANNGYIYVSGLSQKVTYSSLRLVLGDFDKTVGEFTTETETDVTNGNFSAKGANLTTGYLQVGGKYKAGAFNYYNRVIINREQPQGWATVNDLTCWSGSSTKNTWFMVPSTYLENGYAVIRSVGYNHNGQEPSRSGSFGNTNYYCENAPSDAQLQKAAGELFLGSYSFSGSANRANGLNFGSRPMSVSFEYKYVPVNGEQAQADVMIYDAAGEVVASQTVLLSAVADMTSRTVKISNYKFGKKAAKLYIAFRSTRSGVTPAVNIPSGSALKESGVRLNTDYYWTLSENTYKALATGSVLTIDNVKLGYADAATVTPAPRRNKIRK